MQLPPINAKNRVGEIDKGNRMFGPVEVNKKDLLNEYLSGLVKSNEMKFKKLFLGSGKVKKKYCLQKIVSDPQLSTIKDLRKSPEHLHFPIQIKTINFSPYHSPDFFKSKKKSKIRLVSNF